MAEFARSQKLDRCKVTALSDAGISPFLIIEVDATPGCQSKDQVLIYGHLDKQPFGTGWKYSPTEPTIENGKLYGRGACDDCYAVYSALLSVKAA